LRHGGFVSLLLSQDIIQRAKWIPSLAKALCVGLWLACGSHGLSEKRLLLFPHFLYYLDSTGPLFVATLHRGEMQTFKIGVGEGGDRWQVWFP
jgi:hypothetical protein